MAIRMTGQMTRRGFSASAAGAYEVVTCLACAKLHLINRRTGKPLAKSAAQ
jgi:hypothetical protein